MSDFYPGLFHRDKPTWKASDIRVKSEGGWSLFYHGETDQSLNQNRSRARDPLPLYRHRPARETSPKRELDFDEIPPARIHGQLPPPKCFTHVDRVYDPRRIACATDIDRPQRTSAKFLKGDDPRTTHSRASQQLRTQPRFVEVETPEPTWDAARLRTVRLSRTRSEQRAQSEQRPPRRRPRSEPGVPSLFARSLKSRIAPIPEWPRDSYWPGDDERSP
jgi:hypothetical protein